MALEDKSVLLCLLPLRLVKVHRHESGDCDAVADEEARLRADEGKRDPIVFYCFGEGEHVVAG